MSKRSEAHYEEVDHLNRQMTSRWRARWWRQRRRQVRRDIRALLPRLDLRGL